MKQILAGRATGNFSNSAVGYVSIEVAGVPEDAEAKRYGLTASGGTLSHLRVDLDAAPGSGKSYTFAVMKNGVAQSLSVAISDAATTGEDTSNTVTYAAGDRIVLRCTPAGTPTATTAKWASQWEGSTNGVAICTVGGTDAITSNAATRYASLGGGYTSYNTTVGPSSIVWDINATLTALYVYFEDPPGAGNSWTLQIYKNGVAEASSAVTISDANETGNATGLTIDIAPGDTFALEIVPASSPTLSRFTWGIAYTPDTDGEWNVSSISPTESSNAQYEPLGANLAWNISELPSLLTAAAGAFTPTVLDLRGHLTAAPGATDTRSWTLLKDSVATALSATAGSADTAASDSGEITIGNGELISVQATETGDPDAATNSSWAVRLIDDAALIVNPTISTIVPDEGPKAGGTTITITGTGFVAGAAVTVGGAAATGENVVSSTEMTAVTPSGTVGAQDVVVTNTDTGTVTSTGGFTYTESNGWWYWDHARRRRNV